MRLILENFRIVDEKTDSTGRVVIEDGIICESAYKKDSAAIVIDGASLISNSKKGLPILMPAFADLHAHFRDPGFPQKETLESASLAAAAGGFGTVVCMANTNPVIDNPGIVQMLKKRSAALGLIDLYPVMSLTRGMEGKELSEITALEAGNSLPLMLSEDGKDPADDKLFLAALKEAKRIGIPVSCHCDLGGESNAVSRVIELGKKAGCHIHIAHVSTKESVEIIRRAKAEKPSAGNGFTLSCEVMPHNLCLTEEDALKLGKDSHGKVNPPLRTEEDRKALIRGITDGTIDAIATDHAPHTRADKEAGAPGFSGFETAFAAVYTEFTRDGIELQKLSSLMSASPARLLGLGHKIGRVLPGYKADLVILDTESSWIVDPEAFKSRGKNSAFTGRELFGKIIMTIHSGRIVFQQ